MKRWLRSRPVILAASINAAIGAYFLLALSAPASSIKTAMLPGKTTHGHYQIEMACSECHGPVSDDSEHSSENVMQDTCLRCHGDQLKGYDTHPAKKFNDPVNAELLTTLDAQNCVACHREHVPEQTLEMGLTMPSDYCWHCHQDVAESRPSHEGMAFDSCATAGCHNYHNNLALYEKFLANHHGEPDHLAIAVVPARPTQEEIRSWLDRNDAKALTAADAIAPASAMTDQAIIDDWASSAHAAASVNCRDCHRNVDADGNLGPSGSDGVAGSNKVAGSDKDAWSNEVSLDVCRSCHDDQVDQFLLSRHGMRLASGLSPMTPELARLPMHAAAAHAELTCNACHSTHRYDTVTAAVEACQRCHADAHTLAYADTAHAELWRDEVAGTGETGSGVSCATCHLPRLENDDGVIRVHHNQNDNLRPNETMARQVCLNCHSLEYSLSSLADPRLAETCYGSPPGQINPSVQMAHDFFAAREAKSKARRKKRSKDSSVSTQAGG